MRDVLWRLVGLVISFTAVWGMAFIEDIRYSLTRLPYHLGIPIIVLILIILAAWFIIGLTYMIAGEDVFKGDTDGA